MSAGADFRCAIENAREAIDEIDLELVRLLNARAQQAAQIGRAKQVLGEAIYQPDREQTVFARVLDANRGPLDDEAMRRVFERILDEARRFERFKNPT